METILSAETANLDVVRSWKDPRYRRSLSAQQLQSLPDHPAGPAMLTAHELKIVGGLFAEEGFADTTTGVGTTAILCTIYTYHNFQSCGCP